MHGGRSADHLEQGETVNIFHVPVGNDQVDIGLFELTQRIAAGFRFDDVLKAELGEDVFADAAHGLLVINDQDADSARLGHKSLPSVRWLPPSGRFGLLDLVYSRPIELPICTKQSDQPLADAKFQEAAPTEIATRMLKLNRFYLKLFTVILDF